MKLGWCLTGHHKHCPTNIRTQLGVDMACQCACHNSTESGIIGVSKTAAAREIVEAENGG